MYKVAVVILNWNGAGMLKTFLPSVIAHSASTDIKVYVADNGSTDNSIEVVRTNFPDVDLIALDQNYGFAEGYNRALEQVEAEYVVLLNSDIEVTPDWLAPQIEYMDNNPDTVACQPKIRSYNNKEMFEYAGAAGGFLDRYGYPFCRGRIMGVVERDNGQYDSVIPVLWASGAALFIRLKDYREAGGLDERFFAHMEEIDLCWRLRCRGWNIVCVPQSIVYHVGGATLKKENPHKTFLNFRNNLVMLYKNLPDNELSGIMRTRKVLDYLAALSYMAKGQLSNAKAVLRAGREYNKIRDDFREKRMDNIKKTVTSVVPQRTKYSILAAYYLKGKRYFSQLK